MVYLLLLGEDYVPDTIEGEPNGLIFGPDSRRWVMRASKVECLELPTQICKSLNGIIGYYIDKLKVWAWILHINPLSDKIYSYVDTWQSYEIYVLMFGLVQLSSDYGVRVF